MGKLILRAKTNINAIKRKAKRRYSSTKLSFREAFQEARRLGKEEFIYNGKKYGTKLKEEVRNLGSKFLSDDSKSQPILKSKLNQTTNLPIGDSYLPLFNTLLTYLYNYNNSPEGLMWGVGSEKNPVQLSEVVVTATRPRESYNVKANSLKQKLGKAYQGEKCAKWRNDLLNAMGFEIYGDAWTTANFADKVFSGFDGLKRPKTTNKENLEEFSAEAARNFADNFSLDYLNPQQVYVVGTTYKGSPNKKLAFENGVNGEANTHTGYAKYENGLWMFHSNAGGTEYVSPMNKMLGDTASMAITSIYKPRLKKLKNGGLISRRFKIGGYFSNGKVIKGDNGLVIVLNPDKVPSSLMDSGARLIMAELMDQYDYYTQNGITPEEYIDVAKAIMGVGGSESKYGDSLRYWLKKPIPPELTPWKMRSRGIFLEKVGQDYIGESPETLVRYRNEYGRYGMDSLSKVPSQVAKSPRRATQSALIKMVDNVRQLRNTNLTNKYGQLISLPDALTFAWHYGMPSDWSKADVINDLYTKSARNYSNNFEYLRLK